jgi:arabinosyltransferase B/arabinosyltransferase C
VVLLGLVAVLSALLAARGPAISERAVYTWPRAQSPSATQHKSWFAPMFLARREAQKLVVDVPCGRLRSLSGPADRVLVVATARDTARWNGLEVTRSSRPANTLVRVGGRTLARLPSSTGSCVFHLRFEGLRWSVDRNRERIESGTLGLPVGITGLFTHLDIPTNPGLRVTVQPYAQDTRASDWQTVLRIIAALSVVAAALLVATPFLMKRSIRLTRPRVCAQDVVVGLCLTTYWILAPLQDDDGWVRARQTNYLVSGGFSSYFQHQGVNLPLVTWFEWLQHFAVAHTGSLVVNRLPSVAILAATWLVCRTCLCGGLGRPPSRRDVAWWSATAAFALGSVAFGITLRPEPAIALLAVAVLACCLRYAKAPNPLLLVAGVLMSGAALTVHHSGAVAAAPLLVSIPRVYSNARRRIGSSPLLLLGIALTGVAWTLLLAFVDGDLRHRLESIDITGTTDPSTGKSPLQEFERYRRLLEIGSTPLRREFVALLFLCIAASVLWRVRKRSVLEILLAAAIAVAALLDLRQRPLAPEYIALLVLCVAAWVLWRVAGRSLPEKLPVASLAIALVLLTLTPSKWIWHFGAFLGLGAVAVGVEANRLAIDRRPWVVRWACAVAVLASALWAARGSFQWTTFQSGSSAAWNDVPYVPVVLITTVAAVIGSLLIRRRDVSFRPELVALLAVVAALLGTTTVALAVEAGRTPGWTAARQALSGLLGKESCGMATGLTVAVPNSMRPLAAVGSSLRRMRIGRVAASGSNGSTLDRTSEVSWFHLPRRKFGLLVTPPRAPGDELVVTWGRLIGHRVQGLGSGVLEPAAGTEGLARARRVLIGERSFPPRPADADVVRLEPLRDRSSPNMKSSLQFVSYSETRLDRHMRQDGVSTLVTPYLLEGFPCVKLPPLEYGVAGVPDLIVEGDLWDPAVGGWSPFAGVTDVYDVVRVPIENWDFGRGGLYVYWVVRRPSDVPSIPTRRVESS